MSALDPLLYGQRGSGIYRLAAADPAELHSAVEERGWDAAAIDGATVSDKASLLAAMAEAFHFPDWFGNNWDALDDCLRDLSWAPAEGRVVLWSSADTLARAQPATMAAALDVLSETAAWWSAEGRHFSAILIGEGPGLTGIPELA